MGDLKLPAGAVNTVTGFNTDPTRDPDARRHGDDMQHSPLRCIWLLLLHHAPLCPSFRQRPSHTHMNNILGRSANAVTAREQANVWCYLSLTRRTVVVLITLCSLVVLLPTACSWLHHARTTMPAVAAQLVESETRPQEPDSATFAVCVMMRVAADDPQWVDGRAEDVHEVRDEAA